MPRVALVSSRDAAGLDEDLAPLLVALQERGAMPEVTVWDDAAVPWQAFDLAIVRSTWDYAPRRDEFLRWADHVTTRTRLANAAPVLRWNTHKRYLAELAARGVPVVPTHWVEPGDSAAIPFTGDVVAKPAVSAGARDTARHAAGDPSALAHVRQLQSAGRSVMVQPYLPRIDAEGETALVFLGGAYSHAFRKGAILDTRPRYVGGLFAHEDIRAREPSRAERDLAERALDAAPFPRRELLYARVDVVPGADGQPLLLELEATEPSLYFALAPGSAARLAHAIVDRCRGDGGPRTPAAAGHERDGA